MLTVAAAPVHVAERPAGTALPAPNVNGPSTRAELLDAVEAIEDLIPSVGVVSVAATELDACAYCPRTGPIDPHDGVVVIARQHTGSPWVTRDPCCPGCIGQAVGEARYDHPFVWIEFPTAVTA